MLHKYIDTITDMFYVKTKARSLCFAVIHKCINTITDVFYGGEALTTEQPQSYTCPLCSRMGYSESSLHEHVTADHADASAEVVRR